jgi:phosphoribosylformylglycinamidine synthase
LNPYEGGKIAVAEAARNVACSGAIPRAITDCLNFGSPEDPEIMWQFVKATDGMADACRVLETPVVSGNVSFYNETTTDRGKRAVFPTPTVVCVGVLEDVEKRMTSFFKEEGM